MYKSQVKQFDTRHGGAFDRGSADSYYGRPRRPHYYSGPTHTSNEILEPMMTQEQIKAYHAGYSWNEQFGDKKSWE